MTYYFNTLKIHMFVSAFSKPLESVLTLAARTVCLCIRTGAIARCSNFLQRIS